VLPENNSALFSVRRRAKPRDPVFCGPLASTVRTK
jgi:hypothetical protein